MLGPEFNSWPFRLQDIVIGKSPCDTTHVSCAKTPVLTTADPKEKGTITGGSKKGNRIRSKGIQDVRIFPVPSHRNLLNTIDIQFRGVRDRARGVGGSTGVLPGVGVVHTGDNQHAGSPAQHGCGDAGPRVQFCALEAPSDGDWHVAL